MSKKKRYKKLRIKNQSGNATLPAFAWHEDDGFHMLTPGIPPSPALLEQMTKVYREKVKNSPLWDEMVIKFGEQRAEELLKQFRVKVI